MPELPEVEVTRLAIQKFLDKKSNSAKQTIAIQCNRKNLRYPFPKKELALLVGQKFLSIERRAKYLKFNFDKQSFVVHLGMSGAFRIEKKYFNLQKHDHFVLEFQDKSFLVLNDPRRFGFVIGWPGDWQKVTREKLGFEPFDLSLTAEKIFELTRSKKNPIKSFLMDQKNIVGIGNIYASEILFRSQIRPTKRTGLVTAVDCSNILHFSREILQSAIEAGGSTIRDFSQIDGGHGYFQNSHFVYGREGEACFICKTKIQQKIIAGRSSFWCSKCQP